MDITKTITDNKAVIKLSGWLDTKTTPELAEVIDSLPAEISEMTLDLGELEYISSAGLRQIVAMHKKVSGNLTITNAGSELMQLFKMTGFDKKLKFE
ncbi:MAG: STAS domain-containing protein [Clostridiales bacterium]|nr:STAS domain-containing protein [Clostridiales bacterium]